ncbi:type II toxin-antitoxin system RelE/ParE family toxin [Sphingomonas immobilis]|uniref:Type II toxin-antitoxin system RelE/ParE family toxin n=1 Tax=Sphingomonas immobilis TaxID=3063997 RepID=A0ABT8ZX21_9SPHN|nr:type II toxin-antitoxin system RelE/ParE family toxin [Sphingomonas sp. CA1-15]MDO7841684.1 type II toxin-antitoxin system RelE/ParE family toxin [Sphingomonas sp. CA1-15]
MSQIFWSDLAIADLQDIDDYWSQHSLDVAERMADRIEHAAAFLVTAPRAGPAIPDSEARKWGVASTPYLLVYRLKEPAIEILRIHHGRQNWRDV